MYSRVFLKQNKMSTSQVDSGTQGIKIKKITVEERHAWYEHELKRLGELLKKTNELSERIQILEHCVQERDSRIQLLEQELEKSSELEQMYQNKITVLTDSFTDKLNAIVVSRLGTVALDKFP